MIRSTEGRISGNETTLPPATTAIVLTEPSVIYIAARRADLVETVRAGRDLILRFANGEEIRIDNYYSGDGPETESMLVFDGGEVGLLPLLVGAGAVAAIGGGGGGGDDAPDGPPAPDTRAPVLVSAQLDGDQLVLTYDELLDAANPPTPGDFSVTVNGQPVAVTGAAIIDDTVVLTLAEPTAIGDTVLVSYVDPTAANDAAATQDLAGNDAASLVDAPVENLTGPMAPDAELVVDTGVDGDGLTNDGSVTVTGLEAGSTWEYSVDGGTTWLDGSGTEFVLAEGDYAAGEVLVRQTDAAGNTGPSGALGAVVVDQTGPVAPGAALAVDSGAAGDGLTNDGSVTVTGLETGSTWEYSVDGGTTWLDGSGTEFVLAEGDYAAGEVLVRQTDAAGNTGPSGALGAVVVDQTGPVAPGAALAVDSGAAGDGLTNDGSVNVTGLETGSTWEYSADGGTTWLDGSGTEFVLAEGDYAAGEVLVRQTDAAGNTGPSGALGAVVVDQTGPVAPGAALAVDSGAAGDGLTNDGSVTVTGLEAGSTWEYSVDGGTTWLDGSGTEFVLAEGDYAAGEVLVRQTDAAGNTGPSGALGAVVVDQTGPVVTIGVVSGDDVLNAVERSASLVVAGTAAGAEDGQTLTLTLDGQDYTATVLSGAWSVLIPATDLAGLADGQSFTLSATVADRAGNLSAPATRDLAVDVTAPQSGVLSLGTFVDSGVSSTDFISSDDSFDLVLTGSEVGADVVYERSADGGGTWQTVLAEQIALADGAYQFRALVTDAAGNTSISNVISTTVDQTTPVLQSASVNGAALTLVFDEPLDPSNPPLAADFVVEVAGAPVGVTAVAIVGSTVVLTLDQPAAPLDDVEVAYTDSVPADADAILDRAGNIVSGFGPVPVLNVGSDTTPPVFQSAAVDGDELVLTYDEALDPANPPAPGDFVVTVDGAPVAALSASVVGATVVLALASPVGNGQVVTVSYTDPTAGNDTAATQDLAGNDAASLTDAPVSNVTPDATAPLAPGLALAVDSGLPTDGVTNDGTVNVTGLEPLATWEYSLDGGVTWDPGSAASFVVPPGTYAAGVVQVRQTDVAGNTGPAASLGAVRVDVVPPVLQSAEIDGDQLTLTYDEALLSGQPPVAPDFTVNVNGVPVTVSSLSVSGSTVILTLAAPVGSGDVVTLDYADPTAGDDPSAAQDIAGNDAASLIGQAVTNVTPDLSPPVVTATTGTLEEDGVQSAAVVASGSVPITDGNGSGVASVAVTPPTGLTSGGIAVAWDAGVFSGDTLTLTGTAGGLTVAVLTVTTAGAYELTLSQPLDHPLAGVPDSLPLTFAITATDTAGNTSTPANLTIGLIDGLPSASAPALFSVTAPTGGTPITGNVADDFGADGAGHVAQVSIDGLFFSHDGAGNLTVSGASDLVPSSGDYSFDSGTRVLTILTAKGETLVIDMDDGSYSYTATGVARLPAETQVAPEVALGGTESLLGLVGLQALGLLDFSSQQAFQAGDDNNNIRSVTITVNPLVTLGGSFEASTALAAEFGLSFDNSDGSTLLSPVASITITSSTPGAAIDIQRLNEFLGTLYFDTALSLGIGTSTSITATDTTNLTTSFTSTNLLDVDLLETNPPAYLIEGDVGANTLNGTLADDRLYGFGGNDTINGNGGSDILRGGAGADVLDGGSGNDLLIGGAGNDNLSGGTGLDVLRWEAGDAGTAGSPATDTLTDFDARPIALGGDVLDLRNLLAGEGTIGASAGNLTNYIHLVYDPAGAGTTVVSISTTGGFLGGFLAGAVDQVINLTGVNLVGSAGTVTEAIETLLANGTLQVDEATSTTTLLGGTTSFDVVIEDGDGDGASTSLTFDGTGETALPPSAGNVAPQVQVETEAILSLLGLDATALIQLGGQDLTAVDVDGNLQSVTVAYQSLLNVSLVPVELTASQELAASLGLQIEVTNNPGILGLVASSSVLRITAIDGGEIDNLAVNELLASVEIANASTLLGLGVDLNVAVLDNLTISATDTNGLTSTDLAGRLLDANVLTTLLGDVPYVEGTVAANALVGTGVSDRLYGYGGNDTLTGGGGADILRGGDGDDLILIADDAFVVVDGGVGIDTLRIAVGAEIDLSGSVRATGIEVIDLGLGDAGCGVTLTEAAILALTDEPDLLRVTGDGSDTVTALGAVEGALSAGFRSYTLGSATFEVEETVTVLV